MTRVLPLIAVDTCIVLDLLLTDPGPQARARWFFSRHDIDHRVVLPAIVIAEIAGAGQINGTQGGQNARRDRVERAWQWIRDSRYIVAELTERVAYTAAELATEHLLKGADAVVVATAAASGCRGLCTRDKSITKIGDAIPGLTISEPVDPPTPEEDLFTQRAED